MPKRALLLFGAIVLAATAVVIAIVMQHPVPVLQPQGEIAHKQYQLLLFAAVLSLFVVIPVWVMTIVFAWRYRESAPRSKQRYRPNWDHHRGLEAIWWGIPIILISILSIVTWRTSHELDPFKPLAATHHRPLTVQVVALQWRWLFIYPEQSVATVNYLRLPTDTPVTFQITADAPMNSFWIPQLGGQIYAMSGMSTSLNLAASQPGTYYGSSANLSGEGFADMKFPVIASSSKDFTQWIRSAQKTSNELDSNLYSLLARPNKDTIERTYGSVESNLYDTIIAKYRVPPAGDQHQIVIDSNTESGHHDE